MIVRFSRANFEVDFGDQRAGRVDHFQSAIFGFLANRWRDAVGAENQDSTVRDVLDGFDEDSASAA